MRAGCGVRCTLLAAITCGPVAAAAQRPVSIAARTVVAAHPDARVADGGSSFTAAIHVSNASPGPVTYTPRIQPPAEWTTLIGDAPFTLAGGEGDSWLLSFRVPARAAAGRYIILVRASDADRELAIDDSIVVTVPRRRGADLTLTEQPAYATSGLARRAVFLLHNHGNVTATFNVRATSSLGGTVHAPTTVSLVAGESRPVVVEATTSVPDRQARDDVVELTATDMADSSAKAIGAARITVVQRAGVRQPLHTVTSTLRLRAADSAAGISRFELVGGGRLRDGGSEELEFVMRGKAGEGSPFGEREEYHVGIRGANYRLQLGDGMYLASPLSFSGQRGSGVGIEADYQHVGGTAYAESFRFQPERGTEIGGVMHLDGAASAGQARLALSAIDRQGGVLPGQTIGVATRLSGAGDVVVDLELAGSRGAGTRGVARSGRVSAGSRVHADLGHLSADPAFGGTIRGATYDFVNLTTQPWHALQLNAAASRSRTVDTLRLGETSGSGGAVGEVTYLGRFALGWSTLSRNASILPGADASQHALTARADQTLGFIHLWSNAEVGHMRDSTEQSAHGYENLLIGGSAPLGPHSVSLYGEASRGRSITRAARELVALDLDVRLLLSPTTMLALNALRTRSVAPDAGVNQIDARLSRALPSGASISVRVRASGRGLADALGAQGAGQALAQNLGQRLVYLEYSTPLALPIGPTRPAGRAQGRVVDQQTGRGVAGALVRLGPQAAITDDDGHVAFAGLPSGAYRLSLARPLESGATVFTGDATVRVDSLGRSPAQFKVAVEPSGEIAGTARQVIVARIDLGNGPDSLTDGGPLEGMSIALVTARDTLYRVTDGAGSFRFTDVPSGAYTVVISGETPTHTRWEMERILVSIRPGEKPTLHFRLVPARRKVRVVGGDGLEGKGSDR